MSFEQALELEGVIQTVLPGTMFRVRMEMPPCDLPKVRIVYRLRQAPVVFLS